MKSLGSSYMFSGLNQSFFPLSLHLYAIWLPQGFEQFKNKRIIKKVAVTTAPNQRDNKVHIQNDLS